MLAIAAFYDYEIWQMDVKTAFLYMMQPEGFVDPKGANKVCKLQRSIYGLVQASRSWNIHFDNVIKPYRLTEKPVDTSPMYLLLFIVPCYYIICFGCFICINMLFFIIFETNLLI